MFEAPLAWEYIAGISEIIQKLLVLWNRERKHFIARLKRKQHDCATWLDGNYATVLTTGYCGWASITPPCDWFFLRWITLQIQHQQPQQQMNMINITPVTIQPRTLPNFVNDSRHSSPFRTLSLMTHVNSNSVAFRLMFIVCWSVCASMIVAKTITRSGVAIISLEINRLLVLANWSTIALSAHLAIIVKRNKKTTFSDSPTATESAYIDYNVSSICDVRELNLAGMFVTCAH